MTETLDRDLRDRENVPHLSRTTTILRVAAVTGWAYLAEIPQVGDSSAGKDQTEAVWLRLASNSSVRLRQARQFLSVQRDLLPGEDHRARYP